MPVVLRKDRRVREEARQGVGDRIRSERMRIGLTQQELAQQAGVTTAMVSRWETGKAKPMRRKARTIAELLGREVWWLLGEDAPVPGPMRQERKRATKVVEQVEAIFRRTGGKGAEWAGLLRTLKRLQREARKRPQEGERHG